MSIANLFKTLDLSKGANQSLVVSGGNVDWSAKVSSLQKDVYLTKVPITIPFNQSYSEWSLPLHQDGSFKWIDEQQICNVCLCLYYKYANNSRHLPFVVQCRKNNVVIYEREHGQEDSKLGSHKLFDNFPVDANVGDVLTYHIKKLYDDAGDFVILPLSYITYEVL